MHSPQSVKADMNVSSGLVWWKVLGQPAALSRQTPASPTLTTNIFLRILKVVDKNSVMQ